MTNKQLLEKPKEYMNMKVISSNKKNHLNVKNCRKMSIFGERFIFKTY